jgi:hypothetical protein
LNRRRRSRIKNVKNKKDEMYRKENSEPVQAEKRKCV